MTKALREKMQNHLFIKEKNTLQNIQTKNCKPY